MAVGKGLAADGGDSIGDGDGGQKLAVLKDQRADGRYRNTADLSRDLRCSYSEIAFCNCAGGGVKIQIAAFYGIGDLIRRTDRNEDISLPLSPSRIFLLHEEASPASYFFSSLSL